MSRERRVNDGHDVHLSSGYGVGWIRWFVFESLCSAPWSLRFDDSAAWTHEKKEKLQKVDAMVWGGKLQRRGGSVRGPGRGPHLGPASKGAKVRWRTV